MNNLLITLSECKERTLTINNMKWVCFVGILLLGLLSCRASEEDLQDISKSSEDDDFYSEVKELFEKKCKQAGGEAAYKNLTRVFDGVKICLTNNLPKNKAELKELKESGEGSSEDICSSKRGKVRKCFDDFLGAWEGCSESTEKYLPHFVFDVIEAILDYICTDEIGFITKVVNSLECVNTLMENENADDACNDKLKFLKDDTSEEITITKEELCQDLTTAKTCYGGFIEKQCPGSEFKDLVVGLFNAVHTACDKKHKRSFSPRFSMF